MLGKRGGCFETRAGVDRRLDGPAGMEFSEEVPYRFVQAGHFNGGRTPPYHQMDWPRTEIDGSQCSFVARKDRSPNDIDWVIHVKQMDGRMGDEAHAALVYWLDSRKRG